MYIKYTVNVMNSRSSFVRLRSLRSACGTMRGSYSSARHATQLPNTTIYNSLAIPEDFLDIGTTEFDQCKVPAY